MGEKKYEMVARKIRDRIRNKAYPANSIIPDQISLAEEFGVSRMTIKRALDGLVREGLIYSRRGDGTYIRGDIPMQMEANSPANEYNGLSQELGPDRVTSKVVKCDVAFPDQIQQKNLDIKPTDPVYDILRLRLVDKVPYVLEHTFMPVNLVPRITDDILHKSIYSYVKNTLGLQFGGAFRKIHARKATKDDVEQLNAKSTDPILEVEQIVWLVNGVPFEYSLSRNRFDTRSYTILDINAN